jgi:tetratricopeptide (TPR) repeat protein
MTPATVIKIVRNGAEMGASLGANLASSAIETGAGTVASACLAATAVFVGIRSAIDDSTADQARGRVESRLRELLDKQHDLRNAIQLLAADHDMYEWISAQRCAELLRLLSFSDDQLKQVFDRQTDLSSLIVYVGDQLSRWCDEHDTREEAILASLGNDLTRMESKLDAGFNAVLNALPSKPEAPAEDEIPEAVVSLFDEGRSLAYEGRYREALTKCQEAQELAASLDHPLARLKAKVNIASILRIDDSDAARTLLRECLVDLESTPSDRIRENVLGLLGDMEALAGNLLSAKTYLAESQHLATEFHNDLRIAENLAALALVADQEGELDRAETLYDEAISHFMVEYQRESPKTAKEASRGIGICFNNKSVTAKHRLDHVGAVASLEQAVAWLQRAGSEDDLARALFLMADAKFAEAQWDSGLKVLQDALKLATKLENHVWIARCLDLGARLKFTLGDQKGALADFSAAMNLMREKGKPQDLLEYLGKVSRVCAKHGLHDEARKLLKEESNLAQEYDLVEHFVNATLDLADLENGPQAKAKRSEAATMAIDALERALPVEQTPRHRAFLMGRIGSLHHRLGEFDEALDWFARAKRIFEKVGDVAGVANCLGSSADVMHDQKRPVDELGIYREILALVAGTPLHDLIARTKNNLGVRLMQEGYLREARQNFEQAYDLCFKHRVPGLQEELTRNLEKISHWIEAYKPAEMNLSQLVRELHELVAFFPEARNSLLRFWYYARDAEIHANCRQLAGVKFMIAENDTDRYLALVDKLKLYSDLNLQVVSSEFPGWGIDFVPYPQDRPIPSRVAVPRVERKEKEAIYVSFVRGGVHWPYSWTSDEATSDQSGKTGNVLFGRARGLPPQAEQLMLNHSAEIILEKKMLFMPVERADAESRVLEDLRISREQGLIPIFSDRLQTSDEIEGIAHMPLSFPAFSSALPGTDQRHIREIKRQLSLSLASGSDGDAVACITQMRAILEELSDKYRSTETVQFTAHLVRFLVQQKMQRHLLLVWHRT